MTDEADVIVVGAGNAALAAAVSAREAGAGRVIVLEKAPPAMRGGNTHWSGALLRFAFEDAEALRPLVPDAEDECPHFFADVPAYRYGDFIADFRRVTAGQADPVLTDLVVANSYDAVRWMHDSCGVPLEPAATLAGVRVNDRIKWPKGAVIRVVHEGPGLSDAWFACAENTGVELRYASAAIDLLRDPSGRIGGVLLRDDEGVKELRGKAVVLACGGFEANAQWRAQYLGAPWDLAKVRGTPHNQGDGLRMALAAGALPWGHWTGCHATPVSADWGQFAPREMTDKSNRLSYPFGVMINRQGLRFLDEGEDFQFLTYAKFGRRILGQPGALAYQIFDRKTVHLLEPRYATSEPVLADTLPDLLDRLDIDDPVQALRTLESFNAAAPDPRGFDPSVKDGLATRGLVIDKTNWALRLDTPPFRAYSATAGVTFTFGGLKVDTAARVIGTDWRPIDGLYACGEIVGGLFYHNYMGGSGLVSGAVFGRIAGRAAAGDTTPALRGSGTQGPRDAVGTADSSWVR
ncbi:MAG: FAD-dependent tricarballylate dehydrogenase TcuA [Acetobacteraceae bacterium]